MTVFMILQVARVLPFVDTCGPSHFCYRTYIVLCSIFYYTDLPRAKVSYLELRFLFGLVVETQEMFEYSESSCSLLSDFLPHC
jgi:hypothetical protein